MSWVAVAVAGSAILGAVSQKQTNDANARNARNAANTSTNMYRVTEGAPGTEPYRQEGMQAAYDALFGTNTGGWRQVQGDPRAQPAGGSGGAAADVDPRQAWRQQRRAQARTPAAPGGTAAPAAPAPFAGQSPETAQIRTEMMALPEQEAGMYGDSESYLRDTLNGQERNGYRGEAADAARAISADPGLTEYIDTLRSGLGVGGPGTGGGSGNGGGTVHQYVAPSQATVYQPPPGSAGGPTATGTDAALRKLVAGENPAGWDAMEAGISRKVNEGRAANIRELRARAVGSGFYGGDLYRDLETGAIAKGDQEMADSLAAARFGAYQNALGLGTQYDTSMADIAARERMNSANASASAGAASADIASRERLAMLGDWGTALGMGQQGRIAGAGALGDLAGLTSADQRAAVEGINALGTSRRGDLGAAGDLSLGSDQARNQYLAARGSERVGMANVGVANSNLAFDRERFYDPFARISAYGNALNTFYGGLGQEHTFGSGVAASSPAPYGSPVGAGLAAGAIGGQIAGAYQQRQGPATTYNPYSGPNPNSYGNLNS